MERLVAAIGHVIEAVLARATTLIPLFLAVGVTFGFFSCVASLMVHEVPTQSHDVLVGLTGTLGTVWIGVMNFYFGSSAGSAKKTDIMAKAIKEDKTS